MVRSPKATQTTGKENIKPVKETLSSDYKVRSEDWDQGSTAAAFNRDRDENEVGMKERIHVRDQSDCIKNYEIEKIRTFTSSCCTTEVARVKDGKRFVVQMVEKSGQESWRSALRTMLMMYNSLPDLKLVLKPTSVFEDASMVYFVFEYYEPVGVVLAGSEDESLQHKVKSELDRRGYNLRRSTAQMLQVVDMADGHQKVLIEPSKIATRGELREVGGSVDTGDHYGPVVDHDLQKYWIELTDLPYIHSSTSQCEIEIFENQVDVEFFVDRERWHVEPGHGVITVLARTRQRRLETYQLADLPLRHLARYRYIQTAVTALRRSSIKAEVNEGRQRTRMYCDGRVEISERGKHGKHDGKHGWPGNHGGRAAAAVEARCAALFAQAR
ncbi:hypothetical protein V1514DRAFT_337653 [Lipomyces japonicus]|uniref:uncharacterized protein n=1 Tax=Lipomyces japonicus TaxID=56871 RepID=UPI0034CDC4DF